MSKILIAIFIIVFLIFVALGFSAAGRLSNRLFADSLPASAIETPAMKTQRNILILHVDDLNDPDLISVWIVFAADYDKPYISFKSLYPDPLTGFRSAPVRALFSLQEDGSLSAPFVKWLKDSHVVWDGYFLMDQQGLTQFGEWMTDHQPALDPIVPINTQQAQLVFEKEARMYQDICDSLNSSAYLTRPEMQWSQMIPDHMRTDFSLESAVMNWSQINSMENPHCEVIEAK